MIKNAHCEIGMIGLGVMGSNLLLNMADQQMIVAGYDRDATKVASLAAVADPQQIYATDNLKSFMDALRVPRAIMLLVPAGAPVDAVINDLLPYLSAGDLLIDAGNSYFKDTELRERYLAQKNIQFMGIGISGGEEGARHGPSIMPGGTKAAYERVRVVLEAVAAKVNNQPCVTYLGSGAAGHFVKMVHNGIEYGIMQLISETYVLLQQGLHLTNTQLQQVYQNWNQGPLASYLLEITSHIFSRQDDKTGKSLIDEIKAVAAQNGTGMWTSQTAMDLHVPIPTIDIAVAMRDLSVFSEERLQASALYLVANNTAVDDTAFIDQLQQALFVAIVTVYAQGMALLLAASHHYQYQLNLAAIAHIWQGGCIIRAALLKDICAAFSANTTLANLLLDPSLSQQVLTQQGALRQVISQAISLGIATPGLMASLSYFDAYRSAWLPANLIQAQRDYFGSHTYERLDCEGTFHTKWEN